MPKIPIVPARKLIKVLKKKGFIYDRTEGSHHMYIHMEMRKTIAIPVHQGRDLGRGILRDILKQAGITPDEFLKLL